MLMHIGHTKLLFLIVSILRIFLFLFYKNEKDRVADVFSCLVKLYLHWVKEKALYSVICVCAFITNREGAEPCGSL